MKIRFKSSSHWNLSLQSDMESTLFLMIANLIYDGSVVDSEAGKSSNILLADQLC